MNETVTTAMILKLKAILMVVNETTIMMVKIMENNDHNIDINNGNNDENNKLIHFNASS